MSQGFLAEQFPNLKFKSAATVSDACDQSETVLAYTVRNIFWNKSDQEVIDTVKGFVKTLEQHPQSSLLLNEMLSPGSGEFEGALEHAYRRRDFTTMTMHNAKQRKEAEWRELFAQASPQWKVGARPDAAVLKQFTLYVMFADLRFSPQVTLNSAHSSHSYRGLWELRVA